MSPALPSDPNIEQSKVPALPEVEFALVLQRIISSVKNDPAELRQSIYELARMKLRKEAFKSSPHEAAQLAQALETAIVGVEEFSKRTAEVGSDFRHRPRFPEASINEPAPQSIQVPHRTLLIPPPPSEPAPPQRHIDDLPAKKQQPRSISPRFVIGTAVVLIMLGSAMLQRIGFWEGLRNTLVSYRTKLPQSAAPVATRSPPAALVPQASVSPSDSPFAGSAPVAKNSDQTSLPEFRPNETPLPKTYGTYAAVNGQLIELELLPIAVPDNRVAISSVIRTPSRAVLPDGSPAFLVFRRDLANIPTEQIEARVVAKIKRTMKFDPAAKTPGYVTEDLWSIRNSGYRMKVSPVPGNPEMLAISPETMLPSGRYVLALKRQAYDFTVAGPITDPAQCLERIEATNGTFYAPCEKR